MSYKDVHPIHSLVDLCILYTSQFLLCIHSFVGIWFISLSTFPSSNVRCFLSLYTEKFSLPKVLKFNKILTVDNTISAVNPWEIYNSTSLPQLSSVTLFHKCFTLQSSRRSNRGTALKNKEPKLNFLKVYSSSSRHFDSQELSLVVHRNLSRLGKWDFKANFYLSSLSESCYLL